MPKLNISDVEVGMVLSSDAKDRAGRVLLKAGAMLSEKHLKIFKSWGVVQVEIEGDESPPSLQATTDLHPGLQEEAERVARELFQHVDVSHPFFVELVSLWKGRYIKNRLGAL